MFGGPGLKRDDPDVMAGYIVRHILGGGGRSSRLISGARESAGMAYSGSHFGRGWRILASVLGITAPRRTRHRDGDNIAREVKRMLTTPDAGRTRRGQVLSQGLARLGARHIRQAASALLQFQLDKLASITSSGIAMALR